MRLLLERAKAITEQRDVVVMARDSDAFLDFWADDCVVEGPEHDLESREQLRVGIHGGGLERDETRPNGDALARRGG